MNDVIKIDKEDFINALRGICVSDNLGEVWNELPKLTKPLGIDSSNPYEVFNKLQEMDLLPEDLK